MDRMKLRVDELAVDTFELDDEARERVIRGALRTLDPTKCEPHSCVPTFPC